MRTLNKNIGFLMIIGLLVSTACKDSDPKIPNEEEVITTLTFVLNPVSGGDSVTLTFQDLDGDGGDAPVITGGTLTSNTSYNGSISLLNESVTPVENITEEVEEEAEKHQFFFTTTISGLLIDYLDADADGNPVGLSTTLVTGVVGAGTITVVLKHEPDKFADGVADGSVDNAGGETDIEVTFDIVIQ